MAGLTRAIRPHLRSVPRPPTGVAIAVVEQRAAERIGRLIAQARAASAADWGGRRAAAVARPRVERASGKALFLPLRRAHRRDEAAPNGGPAALIGQAETVARLRSAAG
jgi:hypothetical protein